MTQEFHSNRNKEVVAYYLADNSQVACAKEFGLSKQRIHQILKKAGAWVPLQRSNRTHHVGVVVSEKTKGALEDKAIKAGISVSRMAADALDNLVKE